MRGATLGVVVALVVLAACSSGGVSQEEYDALQAERDQLATWAEDLAAQVEDLAAQVEDIEAQLFEATSTTTTTAPPTHTLSGILALRGRDAFISSQDGANCWGSAGYDDIDENAQVVVRDGDGQTLAVGNLQTGEKVSLVECDFSFTVPGVPETDFYSVEVSHRGELSYSRADLEAADWQVSLQLGG